MSESNSDAIDKVPDARVELVRTQRADGEAVIRLHRELRTVGSGDEAPESFVGFSRTMRRTRSTKGGVLVPFAEPFVMLNGIFEVGIS